MGLLEKFIAGAAAVGSKGMMEQWRAEILAQRDAVLQQYRTQERAEDRAYDEEQNRLDREADAAATAEEREYRAGETASERAWREKMSQEERAAADARSQAEIEAMKPYRDAQTRETNARADRLESGELEEPPNYKQEETVDEFGNTVKGDWVNTRDPSDRKPAGGKSPTAQEPAPEPKKKGVISSLFGGDDESPAEKPAAPATKDDAIKQILSFNNIDSPSEEERSAAEEMARKRFPDLFKQEAPKAEPPIDGGGGDDRLGGGTVDAMEPPKPEAPLDRAFVEKMGGAEVSLAIRQAEKAIASGSKSDFILERLQTAMQHMNAKQKAQAEQLLSQLQSLPDQEPTMAEGLIGGLLNGR